MPDRLDKLYDALRKDGAVSKSREYFRGKMLAPGKEGYQNRLQLYKALKADGAIDSPTYEEFGRRLGLHAVKPAAQKTSRPTQRPQKANDRPMTAAEKQAAVANVTGIVGQSQAGLERTRNRMTHANANAGLQAKPVRLGQNPRVVTRGSGGKVIDEPQAALGMDTSLPGGKTYITESGNEYTNRAMADTEQNIIDEEANIPLGIDMDEQQVDAAQQPANAAAEALWKEAEAQYAADRKQNAGEVYAGDPWLNGGREMHMVNAGMNAHKNAVARLTRFDLQKMMDSAWGRVGKQMTDSCYQRLRKQYPTASYRQLQKSAREMARRLSDNAVYKYAVAKNAPKSTLEFFAKTAADMNLIGNIGKGLARSEAGTTGDLPAYEQAMGDYGKSHRWAQVGGTVTGMVLDPTTYLSGGFGSMMGKGALNVGGRLLMRNAAKGVGARMLGSTLTGRVVSGVAGGAANLGVYEGVKEAEGQFLHGGHVNPQTGENEGYSVGDILKSTGRGVLLGSVTGTVSPLLGNVADKWVKATSSTAGKVAVRTGEVATSAVAEGTIFSIPEWISGDGDAMDVWTDNMAMMLGFKAQHMVKSAPRVIAGLRPVANPKTAQERAHNRTGFMERLRKQMDATPSDLAFTQEEREELRRNGYGDLATLFTRTPKQPDPKAKSAATAEKSMSPDIPEAEVEDLGKQWLKEHPEFDGYEAMERLMQDPNVSQSARAKAYYLLTGRQLPMGTVTGYTTEKDEDGSILVKSVTADGEVVTSRRFADEAAAKGEQEKITRQAELNSVDVGERYAEAKADNEVWEAAIEAVAPGADPETVMRNYKAAKEGDKDAIANYGQMVEAIDKFMEENKGMADAERPEAIRAAIKEETGVDVDAAIKKEPGRRTEAEKAAVREYVGRLFPEQKNESEQPMSDEEARADAIYDQSRLLWDKVEQGDTDAKADVDAIVIRMQEAYKECEDAFGTDAEMRMAEMEDNPWALANAPELTDDQRDAVLGYINAKAAMDGVRDASDDAMENKRQEAAANVERHTHKDNGMVQPATMKVDDKPVYIVKGNVVPLPDGSGVDVRNSDQSIVICDAETGEYKFASPDQLFNMGEPIDPQTELDEAYANIQAEHDAMLGGAGGNGSGGTQPAGRYSVNEEAVANASAEDYHNINSAINLDFYSENPDRVAEDIGNYAAATAEYLNGNVDARQYLEMMGMATGENSWLAHAGQEEIEQEASVKVQKYQPYVQDNGESVPETPENVQNESEDVQRPMTDEQLQQYAQGAFDEATQGNGGFALPQEQVEQMQQHNQQMLDQEQQRKEEEANRKPTALSRVPINEETQEPMFEKADKETALDALNEVTGGNEANTTAIVNAQVEQATKALEALKKKKPTKKAPALKGSPMAMVKAQQEADANYNAAMEQYNGQVAEAEETLSAWSRIYALMNERKRAVREQQEAEQRKRDAKLHDAAVAQVEEQKRIAAEKAAEQAEVGTHAVNPKLKEKWDKSAKVEGNPNALTLADGSTLRGHYVLTEAGAASASHDINNAFEPTEGFPIDENGESVNDRDYKRDTDAQQIVRDIARNYDSRALQSPVIVSKDGIVLSGNNRTMSGDMAAQQGTDKAYIDHLREFGQMYGFTPEQIDGMKHPRVVFVPDEELPYDASTFARFNAEQQKKQSKPEQAVKLGKVVPDNVFNSIVGDISRYDRLSDYYADDKAVSSAIGLLQKAGVINEMQLPEMRTGNALSAAGRELIENTLIGKVFQTSPDAVRRIISTPTLRQAVIMGLGEIAHNRTLAKSGYDLSQELGAAVDLVARAKASDAALFKEGMPISPFGRQQGLFDDEYGDSRVTDAIVLLLSDVLNSGKPSDLRKVLATYNHEAEDPAGGQMDMFSGKVASKEELLNRVTEYFRNATPKEQQAVVDAAIAGRKQRAEAAGQAADGTGRDGGNPSAATENGSVGLRNNGRGGSPRNSDQRQGNLGKARSRTAEDVGNGQKDGSEKASTDKITPIGESDFGFVYDQFKGNAQGAIQQLMKMQDGEALAALHHDEIGDIDLVWGKAGTKKSDGYGLAKLVKFHPEVLDNLQGILDGMHIAKRSENRVQLENDEYQAAVRLTWNGDEKLWLLTAFKKKETPEPTNSRTDVDSNLEGKSDGTAPRQSSDVSVGKDRNNPSVLQEKSEKSSANERETPLSKRIATASADVNTHPTEAQKEAGNYKKGHVQVGTFDITIEQPQGSVRKGTDANDKQWESKMHNAYGYFRGTEGMDGDHIDVFLSGDIDGWNGRKVYVVDQYNPDGTFDEHKVMLGFNDMDEAKGDYLANYEKGWEDGRRIVVSAVNLEDFEKWVSSSHRKTKPFVEYAGVRKETVASSPAKAETKQAEGKGYSITPSTYTNKKGKTSKVSLLTFDHDLTADQERAIKEFAKERLGEGRFAPARGWKDRKSGGWMFRSEEDARKAAEMVGNDDAVADNQPLTAQEMRDVVEPKKPAARKKTTAKKPANKVEVADIAEQKPAEPTKAAEPVRQNGEKRLVVTDEMKHDEDILRELLGIGDEEMDGGMKFRDPDALTSQQRRQVYNAGVNYSLGYIDQGFVTFPEFAKAMVSRLGYKIKPWLKSFYEGAKRIPGYDQSMFTPTEEVDAFDVENFDKPQKSGIFAEAQMIVEEGKAQAAAAKANKELKEIRNEQRKETDEQRAADTVALAEKARTDIGEAETHETASGDRRAVNGAAERVDEALDKVSDQLALLGYYEAAPVEKDFNEAYGYMRNAEKKAVKDAADLASQLIDDLGLDRYEATHGEANKKGKRKAKPLAVANIAPVGGDITMHLPLAEGRELYVNIQLEPSSAKGKADSTGDDLEVTGIMCRVEKLNGNDRYGQNLRFDGDVTYSNLLSKVQRAAQDYLPKQEEVPQNEDIFQKAERVAREAREKRAKTRAGLHPSSVELKDGQGNPIYPDGTLKLERLSSVSELTEADFSTPFRNVELPKLPANVDEAIGANGKPVVIKKNIFEKNQRDHSDLTPEQSREILSAALYRPDLYGQNQRARRPYNWVVINTKDEQGHNRLVLLELNENKDNAEIVHWHYIDERGLGKIKRQAEREDGQLLILPSVTEEAGALSSPTPGLSSGGKVTTKDSKKQAKGRKKVKPEQQVGDLFAGLFDEPKEENGLQRNDDAVRTEAVPTDHSGQQQGLRGGERTPRKAVAQESGRPDGGRGGQGTGKDGAVPAGLHGLTEPKNTRNNHSERGADHAPTSVNARIDANIKAIELAHELLESGETATPEQMRVLRQFSGWGGLGAAFSYGGYDWKQRERNKKIRELLGEEAYGQAVMSANSAYYTPAYVVDTLWDIARQLGFKGGNILEGSAGIGNILGQMPATMSERSDIHAIEIDGTSGGILSLLYPDAKVDIQGFEQTRIPNGSVDLAITNVPFVTGLRVNDTTGDGDLSKKFHNIHDFCIAKNVRKLREGGLGIFISSNGTLDNSKALRDWVVNEGGSDFIGAFRMNNKTFGGTTVTSDIIVIRKRVNGQKSPQAIDVSTISGERTAEYQEPGARKAKQVSMDYNKYFIEHPDHMAGQMRFAFEAGDTFRPTSKGLYPVSGKDQGKMLADFVKSFAEEDNGSEATAKDNETVYLRDESGHGKKMGEMFIKDGKIMVADSSLFYHPLAVNDKKIKGHTKQECFNAYSAIKSALADVMKYQTENEDNAGLKPLIAKLNKAYDDFVNTYGHFNKNNQLAWLRGDVDYPNVFSLETYKEQGDGKGGVVKTYGKADVMKDRVVEKESEPHPENVKDGVVVSMFKNGRIDLPYIAGQLGKSEEAVKREIIDSGLGFEDPATRQMEVSYQYLSGNVREKLRQAEANNENGEYTMNIKALQDVVPMDIPAHLIDFTLGSSWLDPKLYDEYVKDRTDIDVHFTSAGGTWFMKAPTYGTNVEKNHAMGIVSEMLKKTIMGHELISAAIQNKSVVVSRTEKHYDGTTETITDREATAACAAKIDEIRQDFKDWARQKMQSDADLSARIEKEYNDCFNNYVPMSIPDDFVPEYFGGATHKFKMRPHQGKAIVRGTMQPLLLAHEVGTGKTFTLISTAMEMRRLGTARKPMIVVQNATVGQFAASAKELYPNAKVLVLDDNDRDAEGRKSFYAKIKYNDWDMVIIPQSTLDKIPDSDERQMQFVQDKIDEKMLVLEKMREADDSGRDPMTRRAERELSDLQAELATLTDGVSKKRAANNEKKKAVAKQNAAVKAQEMLDRSTDDVENFDDMGIDALLIDEAHEYKHLGFATAMQRGVKGVDPSYSKKSQGVYLKTQAVLEKSNGRNVIFATGTPISNTAAEIWTFMRYLMPKDTMKGYGIYYFDDFVRNFGNLQQMPEFKTNGKYQEVNRFAGYVNLPELVRIWSSVADTALTKDQKDLAQKIPDMEGGKAQDIYLPQTRALRSVMKYVRKQLDDFDKMSGKEKKENSSIPLDMYRIAQGAAVDARLVQVDAEDDPNSKTNEAVRQTLRSLKETDGYKGTVAIFADHYQNERSGFNLYEDIKKKLIARGVPADEVVVMKSGMTIKKKLDIFDKVNRGEVRVVLGSTATLGTGVNIQERLHTLIHLDAPNRPMDYTQRNGRILRQGNLHKAWGKPVRVLRFGVEDSLDVTAYQRLKTKGAIAGSIMSGKQMMQDSMSNRVLEEEEDVFGDTVAQLSGSEYALLKNNAEKNVRKYESRKKQWEADQTYIHNAKPKLEGQIKAAEKRAEEADAHLLAVRKAFPGGKFTEITVGKQKFSTVDDMADFIKEHNKKILDAVKAMKENPGNSSQTNTLTLSLGGYDFVVKTEMSRETASDGGSLFAEVHRRMTYSCPELGLTDVPVKQSLLRNAVEDITENVITGKDFAERFDNATRAVAHGKSELELLGQREGKPFEFSKELEEAKRQLEEYSEAMKVEMAEKEKKYAEMDAIVEAATDVVADDEDDAPEDKTKFRLLADDDPKAMELEALPDSELVPVYRNVQAFEDDALGSPMAFTDAETGERRTLQGGKWNYSNPQPINLTPEQQKLLDELNQNGYITVDGKKTTELRLNDGLKLVKPKTKDAQLQYFLKKNPEDKGLWAAYDPYDHAIETPLNTQFGEAYKRPNLVVVRSLIPKSEIDEPFHADYALLPTGAHQWNNGRTLYLSRWSKIDKVLTREEEAKLIDEYWKKNPGKREALKTHRDYNRFVPQVRRELEKMGYRFELDGKELTPEESLALDKQNWESRDVIPGMEGQLPFISNEDIARINAKMAGKWVGEPKEAMEAAMTARVNELAESLNTPVRIVRTDEEVAALPSARQRRMKGSFNPLTGEVTIVVPNNANMADVENTFIHEVVGHDGLRLLFPDEEKLNNALDELYRVSKDEIRNTIDRMAQKMYDAEVDRLREKKRKAHETKGEDSNASYYADMAEAHAEASKKREQFKRDATEEYGADLAGRIGESGFEKTSADELTFWGKLKAMLQKALQKLLAGLKIPGKKKWSDKEWAFVLHEAYKRKKNGGNPTVFDAADTEVMRRKTGFGETKFSDGHKKSAKHGEARLNAFQLPSDAGHNVQSSKAALKHLEPIETEHDAKVLQNREKAKEALANVAETYKKVTDTKGFLTALKDAMGLIGNGSSAYRAFELPNGDSFVMRVSNHNARAHNVKDGERVESIVIKRKHSPNRFEPAKGKVVDEYVYFKEDIRKAPAGTLSSIAESISELLDTGEYHDKTGLARDNHSPETDPDGGMKFRDSDMGLDETITQMKVAASQANADNWQAKQEAMKAIGGNLNKLRQAMARQREYDLSTVKSITDLAKVLLDNGLLDDLSKYETKRILSAVNNAHGKQDTSGQVAKVMDIMVDNQLRMGANMLGRLLSTRGSHVDARGIEVQGRLDPDGQAIVKVVRKAISLPKADIEERMAEALNRMGSDDQAVTDEASLEYNGLMLAHQFAEDITESKSEEKALRDSIKEAKEDLDAGKMDKEAYREYVNATNDAIRQNKIERAEAYQSIVEQVGGVLGESAERAKQWREAERQRVEDIHHNANSDMVGRPTDEHHKEGKAQKIANNSMVRFLLAPLGTFDQMLRMFGKKSVNGEGYLWNRYMRGWVEATEKEYKGYQNALKTLDEKVSEVFGKKMQWGDLFAMERKMPKAIVTFWDGGEKKDHELTQGNLLYIYMVDKMADGRMKLRRMGITEEDVENIKAFVDPRFLELADWMQEEFLVEKRNEYNEVHKRMFGASMAAIENYFPLKILANARIEDVDVADDTTDTALPATSTGSIIKRRRNNLALDVMGADAFSVILDHVRQMERWAAFAEFNRDLNTLLSYKHFRNQVMNMSSVYGGGKTLWNNFRNVCGMAAGAYRPPIAQLDKAAVNIAKGVTAAKVSFRVFTALKQFLSMPAYLSDSNPVYLAANIANPIGAWKWSMRNLPLFEKRWKSRMAGDPRLMRSEMDWKMWQNHIVEIASRIGMSPNAFVDALTVAIGAHAMYETKKKKYLRYGYDEETAEKRAKQDATILFNQTQQSSESAFLSTMQTDRSWLSVLFTVFRNSSMSYTRQLYDAIRNVKHRFESGYGAMSKEYMAKQMRRDGIAPDKADGNAKSEYRRGLLRDIARIGVFGYILQFAWNLGAYLPYLIAGDDKDEKSKMWDDVLNHTMFGSIEGLTGGDVMSSAGQMALNGEANWSYLVKDMPLASDLATILQKMPQDKVAAMNDVVNLLVQSGVGVNPQSLTDAVVAIMDYCGDDAQTSRKCALLIARILNCPQSQTDKIYFDELGATAEEAGKMTPAEIAERYAEYKTHRNAPLTGWAYSDEARDSVKTAMRNRVLTQAKSNLDGRLQTKETKRLLSTYDEVNRQLTALSKLRGKDNVAYADGMRRLFRSNDMRQHMRVKRYKHDMKQLTEKYLRCKDTAERDSLVRVMFSMRERMLEDIGRMK